MELSDEKVLEALLNDWERRTLRKKPVRVSQPAISSSTEYQGPIKKTMARRCQCGTCRKCQETARWEQIFQAKFADPDYYTRRSISHVSPLSE